MIQDTFRREGERYIAYSLPEMPSPVCVINRALQWGVVLGATVDLPLGFSAGNLVHAASLNSMYNCPSAVDPVKASHLKDVAIQLLKLDGRDQIKPPLSPVETDVLLHLIEIVPVPTES